MKRIAFFVLSFIFLIGAISFAPRNVYADDFDLTVHFIDVGQGDACIIELPDERKILVDAGDNGKEVEQKLDKYINDNFKDNDDVFFDYAIMTHSDADHIGSMDYVLSHYTSGIVYRPNQECTYKGFVDPANDGSGKNGFWGDKHGSKSTATYKNALEAAYDNAKEVIVTNPYDDAQNVIKSTSGYEINFYTPLSPNYSDNNNYSPIIVIEYQNRNIVITGDAEKKNESEFVAAVNNNLNERFDVFDNFSADVIKLGHHGSRTSSSEDYLNIVTKASRRKDVFVVISCGLDNEYGHPHSEVLTRLSSLGFNDDNILRTDKLGDIVITVEREGDEYVVKYGNKSVGKGVNSSNPIDDLINKFNSLDTYVKIIIIVVAIIVLAVILYLILRASNKRKRRGAK